MTHCPSADRTRNFAIPRIYYDTNSFLAGTLETLPEVRAHHAYVDSWNKLPDDGTREERRKNEGASEILLSRWNPELAFVSTHTLLETIDVGSRRYGLPIAKMLDIAASGLGRDFNILFAEFEMVRTGSDILRRLEEKIPSSWKFAQVRYRAMARDEAGKELGMVGLGAALTSGAGAIKTESGSPITFGTMKSLDQPQSHTITDPKFERELFLGAAQVAVDHGLHASDALHVLLCMTRGIVIVTRDERLLKKFTRMTGALPEALTPVQVLEAWGRFLDPPSAR